MTGMGPWRKADGRIPSLAHGCTLVTSLVHAQVGNAWWSGPRWRIALAYPSGQPLYEFWSGCKVSWCRSTLAGSGNRDMFGIVWFEAGCCRRSSRPGCAQLVLNILQAGVGLKHCRR